ncbi:MAG: methyltransferase domain-containing protein [Micromonosporaceae bacterium]|nr:methyltransferase domain-containing protein [Micromonosporaceae bacterium]
MTVLRQRQLNTLWDDSADAYHAHTLRFSTHRQITALLVGGLTRTPERILDFGCGPGNSTRLLRRLFPTARVVGLDLSMGMLGIAVRETSSADGIDYICGDVAAHHPTQPYDLVVCSNSFFHVEDKADLVAQFRRIIRPAGQVVLSLYASVFRPTQRLVWPYPQPHPDLLMQRVLTAVRDRGHRVDARAEDREVLTEDSLAGLCAEAGFRIRCSGALRLRRTADERLAFFRIPAVAREILPHVPAAEVAEAIDSLGDLAAPVQERDVYAFVADRHDLPDPA